jgi:hypothetical protein
MGGLVCWQVGKPAPHCLFSEQIARLAQQRIGEPLGMPMGILLVQRGTVFMTNDPPVSLLPTRAPVRAVRL